MFGSYLGRCNYYWEWSLEGILHILVPMFSIVIVLKSCVIEHRTKYECLCHINQIPMHMRCTYLNAIFYIVFWEREHWELMVWKRHSLCKFLLMRASWIKYPYCWFKLGLQMKLVNFFIKRNLMVKNRCDNKDKSMSDQLAI